MPNEQCRSVVPTRTMVAIVSTPGSSLLLSTRSETSRTLAFDARVSEKPASISSFSAS